MGCLIVLVVVALGAIVPTVIAAGPTTVAVTPAETNAGTGDRVSVDVVVDDTDGGIGAWEATLNLSDGTVADIVDVRLHGSPGLRTVNIAEDNDSVYFDGALADTNDSGRVSIATVTIEVTASGRTAVDLSVEALGDERGESYSIAGTSDGTIATGDSSKGSGTSPTDTETSGSGATGAVGGEDTDTGGGETTASDSTPTTDGATPTSEPGVSTTTQTATPNQSSGGEQSTTTTETAGTVDSSTQTSIGTSAPGFTGLASLVALMFGTILLLRRR